LWLKLWDAITIRFEMGIGKILLLKAVNSVAQSGYTEDQRARANLFVNCEWDLLSRARQETNQRPARCKAVAWSG